MPHQENHQTKVKKPKRNKIHMKNHPGRIITDHLKKVGTSTKGKLFNVLKENSASHQCETTMKRGYNDAISLLDELGMISNCKRSGKVKWLGNPVVGAVTRKERLHQSAQKL